MGFWKRWFNKSKLNDPFLGLNEVEKRAIEEFSKLPPDHRIRRVLQITASHASTDFALFKYALIDDPDHNVQFAALKRVVALSENPKLKPLLISIKQSSKANNYEPYLSMAIARIGE